MNYQISGNVLSLSFSSYSFYSISLNGWELEKMEKGNVVNAQIESKFQFKIFEKKRVFLSGSSLKSGDITALYCSSFTMDSRHSLLKNVKKVRFNLAMPKAIMLNFHIGMENLMFIEKHSRKYSLVWSVCYFINRINFCK